MHAISRSSPVLCPALMWNGSGFFQKARPAMPISSSSPVRITLKQAPRLHRVWEQIPEPKYVIAMGACGADGGVFHGLYHVMQRVEDVIPVDVYVAGCPPWPDEIINAVVTCLTIMQEDAAHGGKEWRQKKRSEFPGGMIPSVEAML